MGGEPPVASLGRDRRGAVLLYVDVDNLKWVNDTLGHAAGDRLLTATAEVLRSACGDSAIIGRIGGDEFAVLVRHSNGEDHNLLRKRIKSVIAECNAAGHVPPLSMSIGVAEFDHLRPVSVLALLERADRAMYVEKTRKVPVDPASPASCAGGGQCWVSHHGHLRITDPRRPRKDMSDAANIAWKWSWRGVWRKWGVIRSAAA